ncbi:MAG: UDP-N-acetylmuramate dehydrogenase [Pirellulaceae bacterium]|nr:UDP-N-acetylmuramate dehydrogenase [Pirellulaceae bacterium]
MSVFAGFEHVVRENEPLAGYTWLQTGGSAQYFAEPTSAEELSGLVQRCRENDLPVHILGGGSNLLVRDQGVEALILQLSAGIFAEITVNQQSIQAGAGAKLGHVISTSVRHGLAGLEQLVGIPGSVGGALAGNAGTLGGDVGQWTHSVTVMDRSGDLVTYNRDDLRFSYRQSSLDDPVILQATFELEDGNPEDLTKRLQTLWIVKNANQPKGNVGTACAFKDPHAGPAASLIEQSGLKGTVVGKAMISEENSNFIVVEPNASSDDVLQLLETVRAEVLKSFGVELELSLEIW